MKFTVHSLDTAIGKMTYGYSRECRKWQYTFKLPTENFSMLIACRGGEQGHKVARIIAGSLKRCGKIDGLARANIAAVIR